MSREQMRWCGIAALLLSIRADSVASLVFDIIGIYCIFTAQWHKPERDQ